MSKETLPDCPFCGVTPVKDPKSSANGYKINHKHGCLIAHYFGRIQEGHVDKWKAIGDHIPVEHQESSECVTELIEALTQINKGEFLYDNSPVEGVWRLGDERDEAQAKNKLFPMQGGPNITWVLLKKFMKNIQKNMEQARHWKGLLNVVALVGLK